MQIEQTNQGECPSARWQSKLVRDLAWAIASPPLVDPGDAGWRGRSPLIWPNAEWYSAQLSGFIDQLDTLDKDAAAQAAAIPVSRDRRLGTYFESLLGYWLQRDERYELLARNLAVREPRSNGGQDTLGELDMVVMNHELGQVEHWEVACKFYLGKHFAHPESTAANWVGPGLKDRLDLKVARLVEHQLMLPARAASQAMLKARGLKIVASRVIIKGRLYYPLSAAGHFALSAPGISASGHPRAWWLPVSRFPEVFADRPWLWRPLKRGEWLANVRPGERNSVAGSSALHEANALAQSDSISTITRPKLVVAIQDKLEVSRGFLVPDGWGED